MFLSYIPNLLDRKQGLPDLNGTKNPATFHEAPHHHPLGFLVRRMERSDLFAKSWCVGEIFHRHGQLCWNFFNARNHWPHDASLYEAIVFANLHHCGLCDG